jgi:hypothetical protein
MNDSANAQSPKGTTETERVLSTFDYKLEALDKIAGTIVNQITALSDFDHLKAEATDARKQVQGGNFIGELDIRIEKLQKLVEAYDSIRYNLERLV